jgi:hypothetical protein
MRPGLLTHYLLLVTNCDLRLPPEFVGLFLLELVPLDPQAFQASPLLDVDVAQRYVKAATQSEVNVEDPGQRWMIADCVIQLVERAIRATVAPEEIAVVIPDLSREVTRLDDTDVIAPDGPVNDIRERGIFWPFPFRSRR